MLFEYLLVLLSADLRQFILGFFKLIDFCALHVLGQDDQP